MTIYLEDKRRQAAEWLSKLQHVIAGGPLLFIGMQKLAAGDAGERPMAVVEVAVAAAVFAAFYREWRQRKHAHAHTGISWFDMVAGGLLMFEAFHGHHLKPGYMRPPFYSALVTFAIGFFHGRLKQFRSSRHYVKLDEAGVEIRRVPFRHLTLQWTDLASVDVTGSKAVFHRTDGRRHTLALRWLHNSDAVRRSIADHASAAGLIQG